MQTNKYMLREYNGTAAVLGRSSYVIQKRTFVNMYSYYYGKEKYREREKKRLRE